MTVAGSSRFAVVTGGGTAGHVLPALAVAEALVARGHQPDEVLYAGAQRGIETRLVPPTGFPHVFFDVVGFQRSLSRRNAAFVPKMLRAVRAARRELAASRPRVVVSVGGYASMPMVFAARRERIPVVVVSYDKRPGRASQVAARKAAACAVAFPDSPLPRAVFTGAPLRQRIIGVDRERDRADARARLGLAPERFVIAVTGGSQGSGAINDAVSRYVREHAADAGLAVHHVVGERFLAQAAPALDGANGILYRVIGYEDDMPGVYAAADLIVGRAGASTVAEVAATGSPAVLVPWPGAAEDHQTDNARWLTDSGAAVLLTESALIAEGLAPTVDRLRNAPSELATLAERASALGAPHRAGTLAEVIEQVAATGIAAGAATS